MRTTRRVLVVVLAIALCTGMVACKKKPEQPALQPKVKPPVIASAGVLKAGVDLTYPPFGGTDKGADAGIDVDVAAAVAERLGLKLELVEVKPSDITTALADGKVDIMLGATPITDAVLANVSSAGTYLVDGPAIFSVVTSESVTTTLTAGDLPGKRVGAQNESPSFWALEYEFGDGFTKGFPTLREAMDALEKGELDVVVGDAAVGAYIARDFKNVAFAGQFGDAQPLGIAVKKDATKLEAEVRTILDDLAADGTLDTIRSKWLGALPQLEVETSL